MENINVKELEALVKHFRKSQVEPGDHILSVEFSDKGTGSITERRVAEVAPGKVSYKEKSYDYVDVKTDLTNVMYWTDNNNSAEPYNRMGHGYIPYSFDTLGTPVGEKNGIYLYDKLREGGNITFGVWGFTLNEFWSTVKFGMVVGPDDVEFVKDQIILLLGSFQ